jgi:hypothetical protein
LADNILNETFFPCASVLHTKLFIFASLLKTFIMRLIIGIDYYRVRIWRRRFVKILQCEAVVVFGIAGLLHLSIFVPIGVCGFVAVMFSMKGMI